MTAPELIPMRMPRLNPRVACNSALNVRSLRGLGDGPLAAGPRPTLGPTAPGSAGGACSRTAGAAALIPPPGAAADAVARGAPHSPQYLNPSGLGVSQRAQRIRL